MVKPKRRGGQPKPAHQRKNTSITIRVLDALRARLEQAAQASGRSVSEEAAYRMTLGFELETQLRDHSEIVKVVDTELQGIMVRRGWGKMIDARYNGPVFIPPGQITGLPQSGFLSPEQIRAESERILEEAERRIQTLRKGVA
jgi:hypothetical protein